MTHWKPALKVIIAVFAVIGAIYTAFVVSVSVFGLPGSGCVGKTAAQVISPAGEYVAISLQITCRDAFKSHSEVMLAKRGVTSHRTDRSLPKSRILALHLTKA
jgi:hypothetical protein